eukprot:scaffold50122_cov18-Tisochrysis_lutea.AAC.1
MEHGSSDKWDEGEFSCLFQHGAALCNEKDYCSPTCVMSGIGAGEDVGVPPCLSGAELTCLTRALP